MKSGLKIQMSKQSSKMNGSGCVSKHRFNYFLMKSFLLTSTSFISNRKGYPPQRDVRA